jgi:enoyl-CoA hydratase/carnithine racemase
MTEDRGEVDVDDSDGVLTLTIRRGEKRNSINGNVADQLEEAFTRLETDHALRVAIITGESPCFSAGTDLNLGATPRTPLGGEYGFLRLARSKPLIAAIEGYAIGGGFEIALAADLVVAAEDAFFALPEARIGVVANCGALFRAPHKLPPSIALQMLVAGGSLTAARAHEIGFVNVLAPPGGVLTAAHELAAGVIRCSPRAVAVTLAALDSVRAEQESRGWGLTERAAELIADSPDRAEGIASFFERREPRWQ